METVTTDSFYLIGLKKRTCNQGQQAVQDIGALWQQWNNENISERIPNKSSAAICTIYTNYEGDYTAPYDVILGHPVSSLEEVPEGLTGHKVQGGLTAKFTAEGEDIGQAVGEVWKCIWATDLERTYESDYELYALDFSTAEIMIGIKA